MKKLLPIMLFTCLSLQGCFDSSESSDSKPSNSSGTGSSNSSGTGSSNSSGTGSSNSSGTISCNTKVGTVVKVTKNKWPDHAKSCSSTTFIWGSDKDRVGNSSGTAEGACKGALYENKAYNYPAPKTACYCYVTENVSPTSALPNGVWMCWVGH